MNVGDGITKLGVALNGTTIEELVDQAERAYSSSCDFVEWRADYFKDCNDIKNFVKACKTLRDAMNDKPIIFAYRTSREGGSGADISIAEYLLIYKTAILSKSVDAVDVEFLQGDTAVNTIVKHAEISDCKVIISNHDADSTPGKDILINRIKTMKERGADIVKIGMEPRSGQDVDTMIEVCKEMSKEMPIIMISTNKMGVITRIDAEKIGSALTYGYLDEPTGKGQLPIEELAEMVKK